MVGEDIRGSARPLTRIAQDRGGRIARFLTGGGLGERHIDVTDPETGARSTKISPLFSNPFSGIRNRFSKEENPLFKNPFSRKKDEAVPPKAEKDASPSDASESSTSTDSPDDKESTETPPASPPPSPGSSEEKESSEE